MNCDHTVYKMKGSVLQHQIIKKMKKITEKNRLLEEPWKKNFKEKLEESDYDASKTFSERVSWFKRGHVSRFKRGHEVVF